MTLAASVTAPAGQAATPARIAWVDAARGAGIILVVIGHALGGLIDSAIGADLLGFRQAFFAIYTFHMPLFFVLTGLLIGKRVARGVGPFLTGLLPSVVWPYFLWSVFQFSVIHALGSAVNRPAGDYWPTIAALPWKTVSQFWFLHALFWMHVLAAALLPRIGAKGLVLLGIAAKLVLAAPALAALLPVSVKLVATNLVWYALGAALTPAGIGRLVVALPQAVRAALLPLLAAGLIAATLLLAGTYGADIPLLQASSPELANLAWRLPALAAALAGVAAVIGIASLPLVAGTMPGAGGSLAQLGRLTMPIFLLHVLFIAGTRIVLMRFAGVTDPNVLLVVLVAAGLIGPLLVERAARQLGLSRWLGF